MAAMQAPTKESEEEQASANTETATPATAKAAVAAGKAAAAADAARLVADANADSEALQAKAARQTLEDSQPMKPREQPKFSVLSDAAEKMIGKFTSAFHTFPAALPCGGCRRHQVHHVYF